MQRHALRLVLCRETVLLHLPAVAIVAGPVVVLIPMPVGQPLVVSFYMWSKLDVAAGGCMLDVLSCMQVPYLL